MLTNNSIRLPIVISVDVLDPEGDDKQNLMMFQVADCSSTVPNFSWRALVQFLVKSVWWFHSNYGFQFDDPLYSLDNKYRFKIHSTLNVEFIIKCVYKSVM